MGRAVGGSRAIYPMYVVVLNWNLPGDTIACVESVQVGALQGVQVVVVDNGSTDGSVPLFRQRLDEGVIILRNEENLGFARGVNTGIELAMGQGAQSVLLLNNDTIVAPDMIDHLADAANQVPGAGIVGPVIYYHGQPDRVWRFGDRETRGLPVPLKIPDHVLVEAAGVPFPVDYVTACGMLVRREVLEAIGLFDARFFFYFEDADFCRRARDAGYGVLCAPQARMWHKVSLSARRAKPGTRYAESWGRVQFYRTHPHGFSPALTQAYLLAKLLVTTVHDVFQGETALIKPTWAGFFDARRGRPSRVYKFLS